MSTFPLTIMSLIVVFNLISFINIIPKLLRSILKINKHFSHSKKLIYKHKIVMEDNQGNLFAIIYNDKKELTKIEYNSKKQIITLSALDKFIDSESLKFASSSVIICFFAK